MASEPEASSQPSAEPNEGPAGPSKSALKKAEAKAKKDAEKARRAAERQTLEDATKTEDLAVDNYGEVRADMKLTSPRVHLQTLDESQLEQTVHLRAWVQTTRMQSAKMAFLVLREQRSWTVQCVVATTPEGRPVSRQMVKWAGSIPVESFVVVEGVLKRPLEPVKMCRVSGLELHLTSCYCIARAPEELRMGFLTASLAVASVEDEEADVLAEQVQAANLDGLKKVPLASLATHLDNPVMHKRAPVQQAIADVRMMVRKLFAEYLDAHGFFQFEAPSLIGAASEGGANVFKLKYWDKEAYLAQSPQFYKQIEIAGGRKRVYCIGPVFRAENSNTPRHMTEFTGLDLEMEIEVDYHEVMEMLEGVLLHIFRGLKERCAEQVALVRTVYPSEEFLLREPGQELRLTFAEGQKLLRENGPEAFRNVRDDEDMSTEQEKALGELVRQKYKTDFFVLDKFPEGARPFYAIEDPNDPTLTNSYDFFMRSQEILSGGQRVHIPAQLEARIRKKGIDPNSAGIKEYVDIFKSAGVPPHGGGGIGLDRVVAWYLNLPSVKLASYYPRTPKRLLP